MKVAVALWLLRWTAGEVAAYAGRHWQAHGPAPRDSPVRPGWMPTPSEKTLREYGKP